MGNIYEESLKKHAQWQGKIETVLKCKLEKKEDLSIAYTPGVAEPCRKIHDNVKDAYKYTWKGNTIAVISDGTAVLGLGDIGPEAALPVMEGKCILFKTFGKLNAVPIVIDTKEPDKIVETVKAIAPTFGGINLEDISSPRCVEIERRLIEELNIPVFHDDQHGTAIVTVAGLINALKLVNKKAEDIVIVISGAGAAGFSVSLMLKSIGVKDIYVFDSRGIICSHNSKGYNKVKEEMLSYTNELDENLSLAEAMSRADVFIGLSVKDKINSDMVKSMKKDPIIFAMANPEPEINYYVAKEAGAAVVGTGRSDFPNQINNVLAFPGIFKGALSSRASKISEGMKMAAAIALSDYISPSKLSDEYVIPSVFDKGVADKIAKAVAKVAEDENLIIK